MSDEVIMDGQDLINAAVDIGNIEDPERRRKALEEWDKMFENKCDVTFCVGKKNDGHGKDGIHYDATGTSFRENGEIIHTNHDPWID